MAEKIKIPEKRGKHEQEYTTQRISKDVFLHVMALKEDMMKESEEKARFLKNVSFDDVLYLILKMGDFSGFK